MRYLVFLAVILFISGSMSIPFFYESQTLWYKIGIDRTVLRTGQLAGLLGTSLLILQILSGSRARVFQKIFGQPALLGYHRRNGLIIGGCVIMHVVLILVPEGLTNLPIGKKHWPEMTGAVLFCIVLLMVVSSQYRNTLKLRYNRWRLMHKISAYLVAALLPVHVYYVSDSFQQSVPRSALFITFLLLFFYLLRHTFVSRTVNKDKGI